MYPCTYKQTWTHTHIFTHLVAACSENVGETRRTSPVWQILLVEQQMPSALSLPLVTPLRLSTSATATPLQPLSHRHRHHNHNHHDRCYDHILGVFKFTLSDSVALAPALAAALFDNGSE